MRQRCYLLLSLLLAMACSDSGVPSDSQSPLLGPSFDGAGPPSESGFVVTRDEFVLGILWFNFDVPFMVINDARDGNPFCGEPVTEVRPIESQDVNSPSGALNVLNRAELFTRVYAHVGPADFFSDPCGVITGPVFASGTVRFNSGWANIDEEGPGATVFRLAINGQLEDDAGKTLTLHIRRRFQLLPDGTLKALVTEGPDLSPDPFD